METNYSPDQIVIQEEARVLPPFYSVSNEKINLDLQFTTSEQDFGHLEFALKEPDRNGKRGRILETVSFDQRGEITDFDPKDPSYWEEFVDKYGGRFKQVVRVPAHYGKPDHDEVLKYVFADIVAKNRPELKVPDLTSDDEDKYISLSEFEG